MLAPTTSADLLIERYLPLAWRVAVVSTDDPVLAEQAAVDGFVAGLAAAARSDTDGVGVRIVAATRQAVVAKGAAAPGRPATGDTSVAAAFRGLGEKGRAAVWLTEVEHLTPRHVAPVLGIEPQLATRACRRASATLRARFTSCAAAAAPNEECRAARSRLHRHAAGLLPAEERAATSSHLAGCEACSALLAIVVAPRPALRGIVGDAPSSLAATAAARLRAAAERARPGADDPSMRLSLGTTAAAILAMGIAAAALVGAGGGEGGGAPGPPAVYELDASNRGIDDAPTLPKDESVDVSVAAPRPPVAPSSTLVRPTDRAGAASPVVDASPDRAPVRTTTPPAATPPSTTAPTTIPPTTPPTTTPPTTTPPTTTPPTTTPPSTTPPTSTPPSTIPPPRGG